MSFRDWLRRFRRDDTPIGDLARDVAADRCFPRAVKGRDRLERYEHHLIGAHDADEAAVETLRTAWGAYQREGSGR